MLFHIKTKNNIFVLFDLIRSWRFNFNSEKRNEPEAIDNILPGRWRARACWLNISKQRWQNLRMPAASCPPPPSSTWWRLTRWETCLFYTRLTSCYYVMAATKWRKEELQRVVVFTLSQDDTSSCTCGGNTSFRFINSVFTRMFVFKVEPLRTHH